MTSPAGRIATLSLFAAVALAQSGGDLISSLSTACTDGASALIQSPFATCANVQGLVAIMSATGSVVDPVNSWAQGVCSQAPCSQADIQAANANVRANCSEDLAKGNIAAIALDTITANFDDVRNLGCLQASSNKTLCLTNFLSNVQNTTGQPLTISTVSNMLTLQGLQSELSQLPPGVFCTDCNAAILDQALTNSSLLNSTEQNALKQAAQSECGASFGTSMPSDVKEGDSGAGRTVVTASGLALAGLAALLML